MNVLIKLDCHTQFSLLLHLNFNIGKLFTVQIPIEEYISAIKVLAFEKFN